MFKRRSQVRASHAGRSPERSPALLALLLLALLSSACGAVSEGTTESDVAIAEGALDSSAACFNTTPDSTFTGSGKVLTSLTYNHATCASGYMIKLNNYSNRNTLGTTAVYSGASPTTQADCEGTHLFAFVWRSNGTFLNSVDRVGAWVSDTKNVKHCRLPSVHLETDIPGYKAGASWTIGLQAKNKQNTQQKIAFATVEAGSAVTLLEHLQALGTTLNGVAAGTVHRAVQDVFKQRNTPSGQRLCRVTQLDRQIAGLTKQSVIRVGASSQSAADRETALNGIYNALCTTSGTAANLQTALKQYSAAQTTVLGGMSFAANNLSPADRATVLVDVTKQALGAMVSRCAVTPRNVLNFVYDGTLPAGKTGDNLLTGTCSGSISQVVATLGIGSNFSGDTLNQARNRFNNCLFDSLEQDRCNDPRATGAPDDTANPPPPPDDGKKNNCTVIDENRPCTDAEAKGLSDQEKAAQAAADQMNEQAAKDLLMAESDKALGTAVATHLNTIAGDAGAVAGAATLVAVKVPVAAPVALEVAGWAGATSGITWAASGHCAEDPQACGRFVREVTTPQPGLVFMQQCDGVGNCFTVQTTPPVASERPPTSGNNRMCNPDFATGGPGWYENDGAPGGTRGLNQDDRINHCTCELLDAAYAGRNNGIAVSSGCPNAVDKFRQACLTEPYQPRARPTDDPIVKPECLAFLSPPTNVVTRMTKICNAIQCGAGQIRLTSDDGACSCVQAITDPGQGLPCRNGAFAMCTDGDPNAGTCGCVPADAVPLGSDPLCRYVPDDTNWPGLLANFSAVNRKDLFVGQFNATKQFALLRPNRSFVGPTIYRNSLTAIPAASTSNVPSLRISALLSKAPPSNGNVDLQVYVTSRGTPSGTQPLVHDFAGQVRLSGLATVGTPTNVNIPLFVGANQQTMLNRAFNGRSLNIEYTVQGPSGYTRFVGIGSQAFVGASTALPAAGLAPVCPRPSPTTTPVLIANPLAPFATPLNPGTLTLSSGQIALLTDRIPVARR